MIARFEKFSYAISELSRCWHKIATDEMKQYDLKGPYALYFTTLYRTGGITSARLSELCCRDKADVSRAISVLEKKGFIEKDTGYRAVLRLTPSGEALARTINQKVMAAVAYAGKDLTEDERNTFYHCLQSLVHNLQILSQTGLEGQNHGNQGCII